MKFQNNGHGVSIPSLGIGFIANEEIVEVPDEIGERLRSAPFFAEVPEPEDEDAEPIAARRVFGPAIPTPIAEGPEVEKMTDEDKAAAEAEVEARNAGLQEAAVAPEPARSTFRPAGKASDASGAEDATEASI